MALLDSVRDYLIAMGASGSSWPVFIGYMPDDVDQTIGLFETGGFPADTLGRENEDVTFQVCVRASRQAYAVARAKWQQVFDLLQDAQQTAGSPVLLPGFIFIQARHYGPLAYVDPKSRTNMTSNWNVKKSRS